MTDRYRIALADDHVLLRRGIKKIIEENPLLKVVGEASDGLELLKILKQVTPHMVILDISMPNLRGIEAIHEVKKMFPDMKILILTMHKSKDYLYETIRAGAQGYLVKEDADTELFSAIETIRQGKVYVSPLLFAEVTSDLGHRPQEGPLPPLERLTAREREIVKLIAEGKSSREISELLFISVRTVHHHRENIMKKLNFRRTADLVKYAIREGYTSAVD